MGGILEPEVVEERKALVIRMGCFVLEVFWVNEPSVGYGEVNTPSVSLFLIDPSVVILRSLGHLLRVGPPLLMFHRSSGATATNTITAQLKHSNGDVATLGNRGVLPKLS